MTRVVGRRRRPLFLRRVVSSLAKTTQLAVGRDQPLEHLVVQRPTRGVGRGYSLTGHHEIMVPLLAAALVEGLAAGR